MEFYSDKDFLTLLYICTTSKNSYPFICQKPWTNPLGKNDNFFDFFELLVFYSLERHFFVLEYHKNTFSWPMLPKTKKNGGKNGRFLDQNHGQKNLWKNVNFFDFFELLVFYSLEKTFFFVLEYNKNSFFLAYIT